MRWETLSLDISALPDLDALLDAATAGIRNRLAQADGRALAIRIRIAGSGPLHRMLAVQPETVEQQLRSAAIEASNAQVWIEKIELTTRPRLDLDRIAERDDPLGLLVRELRGLAADNAAWGSVAEEAIRELQQKLAGGTQGGATCPASGCARRTRRAPGRGRSGGDRADVRPGWL